jgi:hypothetical protein
MGSEKATDKSVCATQFEFLNPAEAGFSCFWAATLCRCPQPGTPWDGMGHHGTKPGGGGHHRVIGTPGHRVIGNFGSRIGTVKPSAIYDLRMAGTAKNKEIGKKR